jgi:phosphoribosyl-dephospho-CoA transferase
MQAPHRNRLVWLTEAAWAMALLRPWDAEALVTLRHWRLSELPLVVASNGASDSPDTISLGLPAPTQWGRRKYRLQVELQSVLRVGDFPLLADVVRSREAGDASPNELAALQRVQAVTPQNARVYGSYGWQCLTGMPYLRETSDLDLRIGVTDHIAARALVRTLAELELPFRLDGELAFSDGSAIAWREYWIWAQGRTEQVLVKNRTSLALCSPAANIGEILCAA